MSCLGLSLFSLWALWVDLLLTLPSSGAEICGGIIRSEKTISAFIPSTLSSDTRDCKTLIDLWQSLKPVRIPLGCSVP